jgi:hypothetical protein
MKFFRIHRDWNNVNRWHLDTVLGDDDNWKFVLGIPIVVDSPSYSVRIRVQGSPVDFTYNGAYSVPIVSEKLMRILSQYSDEVQFFPCKIEGHGSIPVNYILVATTQIECVDESNSDFEKFEKNDPVRPDLAGNYRYFIKLQIDKSKAVGHHIFRIKKALSCLIVDESLKNALEHIGVTGVIFEEV